ncbi:MAG TPA: metal ABC transporter permease [Patescibacteria group bacterium]|nr:metal ABC transporter permease [Patescibacteria group bacterium]
MLEIFQFQFMIRAFIAGGVIAIVAPLIGNFLVVRRYSLMADTLAHVALAGVALGVITQTQPVVVAVITSILAALGIERLRSEKNMYGESILAIFLSGSLAIASVLLSTARGFSANLFSYLFGSIATISQFDVAIILLLGIITFAIILLLYKEFLFISFDQELASANGIRVQLLNTILIVLTAVTVAIAIRIVGALLIGALMVIPVITGMQFQRGFRISMILSIIFSLLSVFVGLFLAYYFNLASGGSIVMVALFFFIISLFKKRT